MSGIISVGDSGCAVGVLGLPFILISGNVDDEMGARVMTAGAHDFLEKGRANRLLPVIERELRDARERAERRKAAAA